MQKERELEKNIETKLCKSFKKHKVNSIFCKNCKKNYFAPGKEIIFDYDSIRIEHNFEEFFTCQNNFNSFLKNDQAAEGVQKLKKNL